MQDLRLFLLVADELSISRAAARAFVAQSTLSRVVQRLESEVGAALFDRRAHELTPAGSVFRASAVEILDTVDQAVSDARRTATEHTATSAGVDRIRVGVFIPAAAELTRPILRAYRSTRPQVGIRLIDISRRGGERSLLDGDVDVAFLWTPVIPRRLTVVPLFEDRLVALISERHPLANGARLVDESGLAHDPYTVTATMSADWKRASTLPPWRQAPQRALPVRDVREALVAIAGNRAVSIGPQSLQRYASVPGICYSPMDHRGPTAVVCCRAGDPRPDVRAFTTIARDVSARLLRLVPGASTPHPSNT